MLLQYPGSPDPFLPLQNQAEMPVPVGQLSNRIRSLFLWLFTVPGLGRAEMGWDVVGEGEYIPLHRTLDPAELRLAPANRRH